MSQTPSAEQMKYFRRYFGIVDPVVDAAIRAALVDFKTRYPKLDPLKNTHEVYSEARRRIVAAPWA